RRSATSATACWPRTDWLRASRYRVVLRHSESAAWGDISEASQRIQSSFIGNSLLRCARSPASTDGRRRWPGMACWGGQRLYGAFARAPKSAEGGPGRHPPIEGAGKVGAP